MLWFTPETELNSNRVSIMVAKAENLSIIPNPNFVYW